VHRIGEDNLLPSRHAVISTRREEHRDVDTREKRSESDTVRSALNPTPVRRRREPDAG
jgi:hypothetical protein